MPQKPRHLKTDMQRWIMDNRKAASESSLDLARLTGVTVDTARAWESRGSPSADAIAILERHWGKPAPVAGGSTGDTSQLAPAAYLKAVNDLVGLVNDLVRQNAELMARITLPTQEDVARAAARAELAAREAPQTPMSDPPLDPPGIEEAPTPSRPSLAGLRGGRS